jgi:hypothetical protein
MGSETWFSYGVSQAGTFVLVRSPTAGRPPWEERAEVLGFATPRSPSELEALLQHWELAGPVNRPGEQAR